LESETKTLLIVLGPTAAGKSTVAVRLAQELQGEVINCDSMQVYKGFDIGTDKISLDERQNIPHHLLDIAHPSTQFTAAEFVKHAMKAIESIRKKQKLPIITGGTGLYLKALLQGLFPEGKSDSAVRERLEQQTKEKGLEYMRETLLQVDPVYAKKIGERDKIRIIRGLEVFHTTKIPISQHFANTRSPISDTTVHKIGLKLERDILYKKIEARVDRMFERGIVEEVRHLLGQGIRPDAPPFKALGYRQVLRYLDGNITLEEAIDSSKKETRHYAKRQMTWFRKMTGIHWVAPDDFPSILAFVKSAF
jgi:tRNA dimethylallyltransferase